MSLLFLSVVAVVTIKKTLPFRKTLPTMARTGCAAHGATGSGRFAEAISCPGGVGPGKKPVSISPHAIGEHAGNDVAAMVEPRIVQQVVQRRDGAGLGVGGPVDDPGNARLQNGARHTSDTVRA